MTKRERRRFTADGLPDPNRGDEVMPAFTLKRFNPRRAIRKVGAAEVEIDDGENVLRLWMTEKEVKENIIQYSDMHPDETKGLRDALAAYKRPWQEVKE